jgi:membrane-associated phospholipid phosphatase
MTTHAPTQTSTRPTKRSPFARQVTDHLDPKTWIIVAALGVGWHSDHMTGIAWGLFGILFAAVLPLIFIKRGIKAGRWADRHLGVRAQRLTVMAAIIASVAVAVVAMLTLGAPRPMLSLVAAMLATLIALMTVTTRWKISVHSAVSSGTVAMLALTYGPVLLPAYALVALVGWSRIALRDHTLAQVIAGAVLGGLVAAATFCLIS